MNETTMLMMKEMKEKDGTKVASSDRTEKVKIMMKTMQGGKVREQRRGHKGYRPCPRTHPDTRAQPHLRTTFYHLFCLRRGPSLATLDPFVAPTADLTQRRASPELSA